MRMLLLGLLLAIPLHAEEWKESLSVLADPSFEKREKAQKKIIQHAHELKTLDELNAVLNVLYKSHKSATDPEAKVRLTKLLLNLTTLQKTKLGRSFIGVGWDRDGSIEHQVHINDKTIYNAISINSVKKDMPAEKAGLQVGDRITQIGDIDLRFINATLAKRDFPLIIKSFAPGEKVTVEFYRGQTLKSCSVTLAAIPQAYQNEVRPLEGTFSDKDHIRYLQRWYKAKELEEKK